MQLKKQNRFSLNGHLTVSAYPYLFLANFSSQLHGSGSFQEPKVLICVNKPCCKMRSRDSQKVCTASQSSVAGCEACKKCTAEPRVVTQCFSYEVVEYN